MTNSCKNIHFFHQSEWNNTEDCFGPHNLDLHLWSIIVSSDSVVLLMIENKTTCLRIQECVKRTCIMELALILIIL